MNDRVIRYGIQWPVPPRTPHSKCSTNFFVPSRNFVQNLQGWNENGRTIFKPDADQQTFCHDPDSAVFNQRLHWHRGMISKTLEIQGKPRRDPAYPLQEAPRNYVAQYGK